MLNKIKSHQLIMLQIDILSIDAKIQSEFQHDIEHLADYKNKLLELKKTLKKETLLSRSRRNVQLNIKELEDKINSIETGEKLNFYIAETAHLIEKYKKFLQTPVKLNFTGKFIKNDKEKNIVINNYLEIAKKYININDINNQTSPKKLKPVVCNNCSNKQSFDIVDNSIYICLLCGAQQEIVLHTSSYKDIDRINISAKYTYDRKIHFRDCVNQYQGKQNSTIENKVYEQLMDQFEKHHLLVGSPDMNMHQRCQNIEKTHIHLFLKELEYTKHYENVNLIHYHMTGKKPDDISHLEDRLLDDFDKLTNFYDTKFKNKPGFMRKNFINTQYVLYQFLIRYHHACKKEDFTILKTVDRKSFHDDVAKICFEELIFWL